ncbi:hypothetical protein Tco_0423592 [Tanacetum coccineum]
MKREVASVDEGGVACRQLVLVVMWRGCRRWRGSSDVLAGKGRRKRSPEKVAGKTAGGGAGNGEEGGGGF